MARSLEQERGWQQAKNRGPCTGPRSPVSLRLAVDWYVSARRLGGKRAANGRSTARTHAEIAALDHAIAVLIARWMHVYVLLITDRTPQVYPSSERMSMRRG